MKIEMLTLPEIWKVIDQEAQAHPAFTEGVSASYLIMLTGSEEAVYGLIFNNGATEVIEGEIKNPDCTLSMSVKHFKKLLQGDLNTTAAFMTGKLKVKGNIGLALKLENILKKFSF